MLSWWFAPPNWKNMFVNHLPNFGVATLTPIKAIRNAKPLRSWREVSQTKRWICRTDSGTGPPACVGPPRHDGSTVPPSHQCKNLAQKSAMICDSEKTRSIQKPMPTNSRFEIANISKNKTQFRSLELRLSHTSVPIPIAESCYVPSKRREASFKATNPRAKGQTSRQRDATSDDIIGGVDDDLDDLDVDDLVTFCGFNIWMSERLVIRRSVMEWDHKNSDKSTQESQESKWGQ